MNLRAAALALIIFLLLAAPGLAVTVKSTDGTMTLNASQIDILSNGFVATGKAHIHWVDGPKKTAMNADAEKTVVAIMPEQVPAPKAAPPKGAKAARSRTTIKSAVLTGPVNITYVTSDANGQSTMNADAEKIVVTMMPEQVPAPKAAPPKGAKAPKPRTTDESGKFTITARADNADFDGISNLAHLVGNVKIVNDNPALFSAPASMSGDKATLNLKPSGPDDFRFRVESSPGASTITVTPKAKPEAKQNQ